jgi:hypothetical protein
MLDHGAEAVVARTREAPVTAGAGVQSMCVLKFTFKSYGISSYLLLLT